MLGAFGLRSGFRAWGCIGIAACAVSALVTPARAGSLTDWSLSPWEAGIGDWTALLGGAASGSLYASGGEGARQGATGSLLLLPRLRRDLDEGWEFGLHTALLAYHDELSESVYGNRVVEKAYGSLDTPYGRLELGEQDGAAYTLAITGPRVDPDVSIDAASTTFFRDRSGESVIDLFPLRTAEFATSNDAKVSYISPTLYGVSLGASFTPSEGRGGLPFVSNGPSGPDRQFDMLEGAANYRDDFGPLSLGLYAGAVLGHDTERTAGHAALRDWAVGAEIETDLADWKLALGGGYRLSNTYAFHISDAFHSGASEILRVGATMTRGPWLMGLEYVDADASREGNLPKLRAVGYEPSLGYVVNANLQLTLGWQYLNFNVAPGDLSRGTPRAAVQAGFLHALLHV